MPERRHFDRSSSVLPEDDYQHIIYEQQLEVQCPHSLEFWVAVRTRQRDGVPIVIQWCMRCQASEVLTWEEYQARKGTNNGHIHDEETMGF